MCKINTYYIILYIFICIYIISSSFLARARQIPWVCAPVASSATNVPTSPGGATWDRWAKSLTEGYVATSLPRNKIWEALIKQKKKLSLISFPGKPYFNICGHIPWFKIWDATGFPGFTQNGGFVCRKAVVWSNRMLDNLIYRKAWVCG